MGVIYGPQENVAPNGELKKLYESISDHVDIGKENNQEIITLGDFNSKIGNYIENKKLHREQERNHHKGRKTLENIGGKRKPVHSKW